MRENRTYSSEGGDGASRSRPLSHHICAGMTDAFHVVPAQAGTQIT